MPYIKFESGKLPNDVRKSLIQELTKVSVELTGIPKEFFFVSIDEKEDTHISVGGKTVNQLKRELDKNNSLTKD